MRVLYLSQLAPYPPDAGPKVRIFHVLEYLASAGHEVTLVAFTRPEDRPENMEPVRRLCTAVHTTPMVRSRVRDAQHLLTSVINGRPFLIERDSVAAMRELVQRVAQQDFDIIHADQLWMAQYALLAQEAAARVGQRPRLVLDQHNAMYLIPQRMQAQAGNPLARLLLGREARQLARYEVQTCARFDRVVWVTAEDQAAVQAMGLNNGRPRQQVIPICVDGESRRPVQRDPAGQRVTFLGGMHWPPNADGMRWFAREVWPRVLAEVPHACLTVLGKEPPAELFDLPQTVVRGYALEVLPDLRETAAFIVPLHAGGGMRVKIVDAWSWGLPIVSTTIGAEGIAYQDGYDLLLADDPADFAAAVIRLLKDEGLRRRLGENGRASFERDYDWRRVYGAWEDVYRG